MNPGLENFMGGCLKDFVFGLVRRADKTVSFRFCVRQQVRRAHSGLRIGSTSSIDPSRRLELHVSRTSITVTARKRRWIHTHRFEVQQAGKVCSKVCAQAQSCLPRYYSRWISATWIFNQVTSQYAAESILMLIIGLAKTVRFWVSWACTLRGRG